MRGFFAEWGGANHPRHQLTGYRTSDLQCCKVLNLKTTHLTGKVNRPVRQCLQR